MAQGKVFTVEELRERAGFVESIEDQMKRIKKVEPVVLQAPEVIKADVVRIDSPPPEPKETLSRSVAEEKFAVSVAEVLAKNDINPIQELIDAYNAKNDNPESPDFGKFLMSPFERRKLMQELMKYTHPQLKSVEHTGNGGDNRIVVVLNMPDGSKHQQTVESRGKPIDA